MDSITGSISMYRTFLSTFFKAFNTNTEIMCIRFDLRFPNPITFENAKKIFQKFKKHLWIKIQRALIAHNTKHDLNLPIVNECFWTMELGNNQPHYHCILFVNSFLGSSYLSILKNYIEPCWNLQNQTTDNSGLIYYCQGTDTDHKNNPSNNGWVLFRPKVLDILNKQKQGIPLSREEVHCLYLLERIFKRGWYLCKLSSKPINQTNITNNDKLYAGSHYQLTEQDIQDVPLVYIFDQVGVE